MVTFTLTIILAFAEVPVKTAKKHGRKPKKEKKKSKSGSTKSVKKEKPKVFKELPSYAIEAGRLIGSAHVDYVLIKDKLKYQVDVLCWEKIAKVNDI